jgi:hypothetical protein
MNAQQAVTALGVNHSPRGIPERNMIKALQMHPWLNTPEDNTRLAAALYARSSPHEFAEEQSLRRRRKA